MRLYDITVNFQCASMWVEMHVHLQAHVPRSVNSYAIHRFGATGLLVALKANILTRAASDISLWQWSKLHQHSLWICEGLSWSGSRGRSLYAEEEGRGEEREERKAEEWEEKRTCIVGVLTVPLVFLTPKIQEGSFNVCFVSNSFICYIKTLL